MEIIKYTSTIKESGEVDVLYFENEDALNANLDFMKVIGGFDKIDYTAEIIDSNGIPDDEIASKKDIIAAMIELVNKW